MYRWQNLLTSHTFLIFISCVKCITMLFKKVQVPLFLQTYNHKKITKLNVHHFVKYAKLIQHYIGNHWAKVEVFKEKHTLHMGVYGDFDINCLAPLLFFFCKILDPSYLPHLRNIEKSTYKPKRTKKPSTSNFEMSIPHYIPKCKNYVYLIFIYNNYGIWHNCN